MTISPRPPADDHAYECQCARCGSSCDWVQCENCDDGYDGHDCGEDCCACAEPEENMLCQICDGYSGWWACMSSAKHCIENPTPDGEGLARGKIEWFKVKEQA